MREVKFILAESLVSRWERGFLADSEFLLLIAQLVLAKAEGHDKISDVVEIIS